MILTRLARSPEIVYSGNTKHKFNIVAYGEQLMQNIDKRQRAFLFSQRLKAALGLSGLNQSSLARHVGVDRSTISQLLGGDGTRLPNAQVVAGCASALGVSVDWLLGLSERPERVAELLAASVSLTEAPRAMVDEQLLAWHREASGQKIRHVPATLPDMLKTNAVLRWEYAPHLGRTIDQAIGATKDTLEHLHDAPSDYEIALPLFELQSFAHGEGYYRGLALDARVEQIDRLLYLHDRLYPRLRIYQFDARRLYSAPVTIFGNQFAALYLGRNYLVFRDIERVDAIRTHFDYLVREASVASRDLPETLGTLRAEIA